MTKILYGGDYENKFKFNSFGDFIITQLKSGGNLKALVKKCLN
jgi:hypothetical protein